MSTVAAYARVSTDRQEKAGTIASQIEKLIEHAQSDGHELTAADIFADDGVSGTTLVRPALERLRDRVFEGRLDVVYVLSPDRLARRYAYQVLLLDEFARRGVSVRFLQGRTGDDPEAELLLQVQGVISEYERAKILERSRRGKLHRARSGSIAVMSGAPYGYRHVRSDDDGDVCWQIDLEQARIVRRMFEQYVHEGRSIRSIAAELAADGVATSTGIGKWHASTVSKYLRNSAYKGMAAYGKTESGPPAAPRRRATSSRFPKKGLKSSVRPRDPGDWILIPVPAIVSEELFDAAQRRLAANPAYRKAESPYLLQGLTVCACCGYAVWGLVRGGPRRYRYYVCSGTEARHFGGQAVCSMRSVRADALEEHVWESIRATVEHPERVMAEWNRRACETDEDDPVRRQLADCEQAVRERRRVIARLQDAYEAGALTLDELTDRAARARGRLATAENECARVAAILDSHREIRLLHAQLDSFAGRVRGELDTLDSNGRRRLIRLLVDRIEIDDPEATIVYRIPPTAQPLEGAQPVRGTGFVGSVHGSSAPK